MKTIVKNYEGMGRGVQANESFHKGDVVEISPVVIVYSEEVDNIYKTILNMYVYAWDDEDLAVAFGMGSLFNHSKSPNLEYENDYENKTIRYIANRDIVKGEQLFIDYGYDLTTEYIDYLERKNGK